MKVSIEGKVFTDTTEIRKYVGKHSGRLLEEYQMAYFGPIAGGIILGLIIFIIIGPHTFPIAFMYSIIAAASSFFIANANTIRIRSWAESYKDDLRDKKAGLKKL